MAIKALMLRKKIDDKKKLLDGLREKDADFETREAELEAAIAEAETEEEKATVEESVNAFASEQEAHNNAKGDLEREIGELEQQLSEEETRAKTAASKPDETRKDEKTMNTRTKFFGMNAQEREAFIGRSDVKDFLQRTRELAGQKRAVSGADLLIPTVVLDLIRENVEQYSKLYKHVYVRAVPGHARQNIMGAIPEGVWTEMCASLNELNLSFSNAEVDGYKVGGFIAVCNSILEDADDLNLATEIISVLGQAIGLALDKAILYGTGTKMPLGIVTRLAQASKPDAYPTTARAWTDLHTSNLIAITGKTDLALFKAMVEATGALKKGTGAKFWAMNEKTKTKLIANALSINAAGALVTGMQDTMPVIGGAIETLEFIPDDVIVGGYGQRYLLAERAGASIAQSEHVRFIEDQTVFKGTARYDGLPVIPEAFVAIGIGGVAPTATAVSFATDTANAGG